MLIETIPGLVWVALAGVIVVALLRAVTSRSSRKDPKRAFDAQQRRAGFERAGSQCEFSTPWFTRCTRTAQHADHWYPHTRGGSSSMQNLVAACQTHNLVKGARMPGFFSGIRIESRRKKYFPQNVDRSVGEWF